MEMTHSEDFDIVKYISHIQVKMKEELQHLDRIDNEMKRLSIPLEKRIEARFQKEVTDKDVEKLLGIPLRKYEKVTTRKYSNEFSSGYTLHERSPPQYISSILAQTIMPREKVVCPVIQEIKPPPKVSSPVRRKHRFQSRKIKKGKPFYYKRYELEYAGDTYMSQIVDSRPVSACSVASLKSWIRYWPDD